MRGRCLRIGSAGKTFSMTGWKVGYVVGAAPLIEAVAKAHQFLTFTTPPNLQAGVAHGLDHETAWIEALARDAGGESATDWRPDCGRRDFDVLASQGSYFLTADIRPLGWNDGDESFCRFLTTEAGVAAIPLSAFYEGRRCAHLRPLLLLQAQRGAR